MFRRLLLHLSLAAAALAIAPAALASGGNYVFDGGSNAQQAQVTAALNASAFPWGVVPGTVVVHIQRDVASSAAPNQIWLDANLLDAGRFAWGVVQHEYAHEVDFALLTDATRAQLHSVLGGAAWCGTEGHSTLDCERFADLVAWAYWSSADNVMKPQSAQDEGGQVTPAAFRAVLAAILPGLPTTPQPQVGQPTRATAAVSTPAKRHRKI
ncbi:MAG: hypothetical protein ACXWYO_05255 [Gaiellaceae bacterium]